MLRISPYIIALAVASSVTDAHAQANVVGQWGTTQPFPFVSVHTCLMPNGKVIFWDYSGNTRIWDPATTAITTPAQPGRNTFCSGNSFLPNGKLFVAGTVIDSTGGRDFLLSRFHPDGGLDTSFGSSGFIKTDFTGTIDSCAAVAVAGPDRILTAGVTFAPSTLSDFALARYIATTPVELLAFEVE